MQNVSWLLAVSAVLTTVGAISAQNIRRPLTITLSSSADILITRADGKRFGRDASGATFREIPDAEMIRSPGREPVYDIPPGETSGPLTIKVTGREPVKDAKLAITGPGFVFAVNGISLRKGSVVNIIVSPTGDMLAYSSDAPGPVPRIVLGTDPVDPKMPSWVFEVHRVPFTVAGSTIRVSYEDQKTFNFGDDGKTPAAYDLKVKQINADGREIDLTALHIKTKQSNHFAVDLSSTKTTSRICLRADDAKGLAASDCLPLRKTASK